jgi:hypothetical protein
MRRSSPPSAHSPVFRENCLLPCFQRSCTLCVHSCQAPCSPLPVSPASTRRPKGPAGAPGARWGSWQRLDAAGLACSWAAASAIENPGNRRSVQGPAGAAWHLHSVYIPYLTHRACFLPVLRAVCIFPAPYTWAVAAIQLLCTPVATAHAPGGCRGVGSMRFSAHHRHRRWLSARKCAQPFGQGQTPAFPATTAVAAFAAVASSANACSSACQRQHARASSACAPCCSHSCARGDTPQPPRRRTHAALSDTMLLPVSTLAAATAAAAAAAPDTHHRCCHRTPGRTLASSPGALSCHPSAGSTLRFLQPRAQRQRAHSTPSARQPTTRLAAHAVLHVQHSTAQHSTAQHSPLLPSRHSCAHLPAAVPAPSNTHNSRSRLASHVSANQMADLEWDRDAIPRCAGHTTLDTPRRTPTSQPAAAPSCANRRPRQPLLPACLPDQPRLPATPEAEHASPPRGHAPCAASPAPPSPCLRAHIPPPPPAAAALSCCTALS